MSVRALVVEDDPDLLEFLLYQVRRLGLGADGATSLEDALQALTVATPQVVITDLNLGQHSCERLVRACADAHIPVVITTGAPGDAEHLTDIAASLRILAKPASLADLRHTLEALDVAD